MKTTLEIPDDLARKVKLLAAREGTTMRALMTEALESEIERHGEGGDAFQPKWRSAFGALKQLRKESGKINREIAEAFDKIDEDMWQ